MTVECRILGPLSADVAGQAVQLGGPRPRLLLAALLLDLGRVVSTDRLVEAVWGEQVPASGRALVAVHVSALRKAFARAGCEHEVVETVHGGYRIPAHLVQVDAGRAESLVEQARSARADGRRADAAALMRAALQLWRGAVLPMPRTPVLDAAVLRWEELRLVASEEWADLELALGRHAELVAELTTVVDEHPLRERPRAQLMTALWRCGRVADALEVFVDGRNRHVEELGLEPGKTLVELRDAILGDSAEPARDEPAVPRPAELPPAVSGFAGRTAELGSLDAMVDSEGRHPPIAVVSGVAGVGKTALALHWAHRVADRFPDGQLYADLRGHDAAAEPVSPGAVLERFLRGLGVDGERIPPTLDGRAALFRGTLDGRRMLILLDNAASAAQVRPILPGRAGCCVVVTARRRLEGLVADGAVAVPLELLDDAESVELLGHAVGADRVQADPGTAAELGALCENLPLALRVAAARLASRPAWTLRDLTGRLTDERSRLDQLSHDDELQLRGSFELSYRDLPQPAVTAFRRLGLVDAPGGFAPWLLAALLDCPLLDAEDLCEELVDAQLVQPLGRDVTGQPRYRLHELVRLYAREQAEREESPVATEAALTRAYRGLLGLADQVRKEEYGSSSYTGLRGDTTPWLPDTGPVENWRWDRLGAFESERPNLVAAVAQCAEHGLVHLAWDLVARFLFLFEARAYYDDWRQVTDVALAACRRAGDRHGEGAMLYCLGALHLNQRRLVEAVEPLEQSLAVLERIGDERGCAVTGRHLASVQLFLGDVERGRRGLERAIASFVELGDPAAEAHARGFLSGVHMNEGRLDDAEREVQRALATFVVPDQRHEAQLLKRLAEVLWRQGRACEAVQAAEHALDIVRRWGDPVGEAWVLHVLGEARRELGEQAAAERLLTEALDVARQIGERLVEGRILLALGQLDTPHAAEHLRAAVATFEAIGAGGWRETAAETLRAAHL